MHAWMHACTHACMHAIMHADALMHAAQLAAREAVGQGYKAFYGWYVWLALSEIPSAAPITATASLLDCGQGPLAVPRPVFPPPEPRIGQGNADAESLIWSLSGSGRAPYFQVMGRTPP